VLDAGLKARLQGHPLGFGGAPLGNLFRAVTEDEAIALVRHARASGVGYFDTAPHYGNGLSEIRIGKALGGIARDEYVLSSKVGRLLVADRAAPREQNGYVDVLPYRQRWDYSRSGTLRSIDESLQRLGVSRLDIVYIHESIAIPTVAYAQRFDEVLTGAVPALTELREAGTIGGFGLGETTGGSASTLSRRSTSCCRPPYAARPERAPELLPVCERRGVALVIGGPYNSGIWRPRASGRRSAPYFNYAPAPSDLVARVAAIERSAPSSMRRRRGAAVSARIRPSPASFRSAHDCRISTRISRLQPVRCHRRSGRRWLSGLGPPDAAAPRQISGPMRTTMSGVSRAATMAG
jgi:D-threo-aldose 1-dehydrogenase